MIGGMSIGFLLGIVLAIFALYFTIRSYEDHFEDKKLFITLIIGMALGVIAIVLEKIISDKMTDGNAILTLIIAIAGFAIFELLLKTMILNWRGFQGNQQQERPDT